MTEAARQTYPFTLPDLPYPHGALEPHIDATTMHLHHDKHHKTYVDKLNEALAKAPDLQKLTLVELLRGVDKLPDAVRTAVKNNGGQHFNHDLFWNSLSPTDGSGAAREPRGELAKAIAAEFGAFATFRDKFSDTAVKHFASGWVALVVDGGGKLQIVELHDQQVPKPWEYTPLFIVDVWEHAYYLKYQNKRADYITAWCNVLNWAEAAKRL